jgi:hypothetical protein
LARKGKKHQDILVLEKELQETDEVMVEASPVTEENVAVVASHV